jgi:hypothetical protein
MTMKTFEHPGSMKIVIRAALTALSLGTIPAVSDAAPQPGTHHQGPYDNTGQGPQASGPGGGGG